MKLTKEEASLFFELLWSLQLYINDKLKIIATVNTTENIQGLPQAEKLKLREAIYEHPNLIDDYVSKNPDKLDTEQLTIIKGWRELKKGSFYIERYLKNYTVFIGKKNVYGVLALHDSFDKIFPKIYLPVYVNTVLLPFKGKIIYDGLMQGYNVHFGGGIKKELKETYMRAKQNERIILSFDESVPKQSNRKENEVVKQIDWSEEIGQLITVSKKLKGGSGQPIINSQIFSLVRASIEFANKAVLNSADVDILLKEIRKVKRAVSKIENTLYRFD